VDRLLCARSNVEQSRATVKVAFRRQERFGGPGGPTSAQWKTDCSLRDALNGCRELTNDTASRTENSAERGKMPDCSTRDRSGQVNGHVESREAADFHGCGDIVYELVAGGAAYCPYATRVVHGGLNSDRIRPAIFPLWINEPRSSSTWGGRDFQDISHPKNHFGEAKDCVRHARRRFGCRD
jgi:hypothetical protein